MNFKTYYTLDESIKSKLKALGLASIAALTPLDSNASSIAFNAPITQTSVSGSFQQKAAKYIEANEGKRNKLYKDHKGNWTIGIGHLVLPDKVHLYKGRTLTNAEVYDIFNKDLDKKIAAVQRRFGPVYNTYSEDLKIAILDGFFRGDLSGSPKTIDLLKKRKFKEAAKEYVNNAEYKRSKAERTGVYKRMDRNAAIMAREG